jgi:hypothetical protein
MTAVATPDRVTREEAATVFRRAAELEAADPGVGGAAFIDTETLMGIARDAGLSPASVDVALAELRSGALGSTGTSVDVVRTQVFGGERREVALVVEESLRRNLLVPSRRDGTTTVWTRRRGLGTALRRSLGGRERYPLIALKELRTTISHETAQPGLVRVRLEGALVFPWRMLPLRTKALLVGGVGGSAIVLVFVVPGPRVGTDDAVWTAGAILATLGATNRSVKAYRHAAAQVEEAFDRFLDGVRHAHPLTLGRAERI